MTPEGYVLKAVLDYLQAKGILAFRMNSGKLMGAGGRPISFGVQGMADVLAFNYGHTTQKCYECPTLYTSPWNDVLWIECKAPGGKQTAVQKSFQEQVESHGHRYILVRSIDDLEGAL